jgi:plastocyanin domain-containing protein
MRRTFQGFLVAALLLGGGVAAAGKVRQIDMTVTSDGFQPAEVKVKKGEKVRLVITRKTNRTCAKQVVIKPLGIEKALPLDQPVTVEITPTRAGQLRYACSMDHIAGVILVE